MYAIEVVDYDSAWPAAQALHERFGPGVIVLIEHFGSTAVPQLAAKAVIDVPVGVSSFAASTRADAPAPGAAAAAFRTASVPAQPGAAVVPRTCSVTGSSSGAAAGASCRRASR